VKASDGGVAARGVDIHGHGVPRSFLEDVKRSHLGGVQVDLVDNTYVLTFPGQSPLRAIAGRMLDFEQRLEWLDGEHMHHQLVGPWLDVHGQELPATAGQEWVRRLNDAMAESVAPAAGRLSAYATLHLADPSAAVRELERATRELGMVGCMIPTSIPTSDLDASAFDALWAAAEDLRVAVMLHPPTVGPASCVPGMDRFGGLYGRLIDTTMAAARLLLAGVFDRFPNLRLILVHGGGFLPYQTGRLDHSFGGQHGAAGAATPSDYVRRFYFDTVLMHSHAIAMLLHLVGADRVMIGSDYPFSVGAPPLTRALLEAGTDEADIASVTYQTAAHLFDLETAHA
jgi:aminocarboxymuconate-semialdehyde decarboxylase